MNNQYLCRLSRDLYYDGWIVFLYIKYLLFWKQIRSDSGPDPNARQGGHFSGCLPILVGTIRFI